MTTTPDPSMPPCNGCSEAAQCVAYTHGVKAGKREAFAALRERLEGAEKLPAGKPKTRSQKLAEAGFKRRPSAKSLPSDE